MVVDCLSRDEFIVTLTNIVDRLCESNRGCTFAINGKWGCGKSFVLELFRHKILESTQSVSEAPYYIFRYNCWQYDYYEEPAVALVSALHDEIEQATDQFTEVSMNVQALNRMAMEFTKKVASNFLNNLLPFDIMEQLDNFSKTKTEIKKEFATKHEYDYYFSFKASLDALKAALGRLSEEKPILFLIDELDRCAPAYAIKILERLHHIFSEQQNIVVILAVDQARLEHSIQTVYGITDPECISDYLKKFISFTLALNVGKLSGENFKQKYEDYINSFNLDGDESLPYLSKIISNFFGGIDVRTQEKIMDRITLLHKLSCHETANLSVLLFEILHQTISYRCRSFPSDNLEARIVNPEHDSILKAALGEHLHTFLTTLQSRVYTSTKDIKPFNDTPYIVRSLKNNSLAYTFLWFAMVANNKCGRFGKTFPYQPKNYRYTTETLPPSISLFVEYSEHIEFR